MRLKLTFSFIILSTLLFSQKTKVLSLSGKWSFTIGDREEYINPEYDDSNWEKIKVGTPWENEGFANYNGYAWYRYEFDGSDLKDYKNLFIHLG
ncbi:MAG: glycoside hydrolase, partial [Bacteroidota bacterium]